MEYHPPLWENLSETIKKLGPPERDPKNWQEEWSTHKWNFRRRMQKKRKDKIPLTALEAKMFLTVSPYIEKFHESILWESKRTEISSRTSTQNKYEQLLYLLKSKKYVKQKLHLSSYSPSYTRLIKTVNNSLNPSTISEKRFIDMFSLSKSAFWYLLDEIGDDINRINRKTSIPVPNQLCIVLRILAEGNLKDCYTDLNTIPNRKVIDKIFSDIIFAIEMKIFDKWIHFPSYKEEIEIANMIFHWYLFPSVIGFVKGMHVNIKPNNERIFLNDKGNFSINAMILCNHKMEITFVDATNGGSIPNSRVWNKSHARKILKSRMESKRKLCLLGDSSYLQNFVIPPFRYTSEYPKKKFNTIHSILTNIADDTMAVLKRRFRCLSDENIIPHSPVMASKIINICCALHNLCINYRVPLP